jgi:cytochrome b involved in lipid metabolism
VYDLTPFLSLHPGGDEILLAYSGDRSDSSLMFHTSFHSDAAIQLMDRFLLWDPAWLIGTPSLPIAAYPKTT